MELNTTVEKRIAKQVDKFIGDTDATLNAVVKLDLLNEIKPQTQEKTKEILDEIKAYNLSEKLCYEREFGLTYDMCGNLTDFF